MKRSKAHVIAMFFLAALLITSMGCSEPITKREQGGLIGAGLGAGTGAIIGSAVGHAAAGALIGGPIGLLAGALIGDQLMAQDRKLETHQKRINENRTEMARL